MHQGRLSAVVVATPGCRSREGYLRGLDSYYGGHISYSAVVAKAIPLYNH